MALPSANSSSIQSNADWSGDGIQSPNTLGIPAVNKLRGRFLEQSRDFTNTPWTSSRMPSEKGPGPMKTSVTGAIFLWQFRRHQSRGVNTRRHFARCDSVRMGSPPAGRFHSKDRAPAESITVFFQSHLQVSPRLFAELFGGVTNRNHF